MKDWYVLFTGYENSLVTMKRLVKNVLPKGCGTYVPVIIKNNKDRPTRLYNQSLYPFYIFVCCTDPDQLGLLERKMKQMRIDGYFLKDQNGEPAKLTSDEIREIEMRNMDRDSKLLMEKDGFSAGTRVRCSMGPMKGFEGCVAFITNEFVFVSLVTKKKKVTVEVPMLYSDLEII